MRSFVPLALLVLPASLASAQSPRAQRAPARATTAAISGADLHLRLSIIADDSMHGRETGTIGEIRAADYIAGELRRLGLRPAGDSGGFIQYLPMIRRSLDAASSISVGGVTLRAGFDFIATARDRAPDLTQTPVIYGGRWPDTVSALTVEQVTGKIVLLSANRISPATMQALQRHPGFLAVNALLNRAAAAGTIEDSLRTGQVHAALNPRDGDVQMRPAPEAPAFAGIMITRAAATVVFGASPDSLAPGAPGRPARVAIAFQDTPVAARNVVAVLPGSHRALAQTYVALGSHLDHVGFQPGQPLDHDSLHLGNAARFAIVGMVPRGRQPSSQQRARLDSIRVNLDSVRRARPPRLDSIRNGADDDGSGVVTMLEIAEAMTRAPRKPARSILFVWHTGEEKGLLGARWFSEHATVPRDSIVAQLNMDMVGRGEAADWPVGASSYLALLGSRRLSSELGDMVEEVNRRQTQPFAFDYSWDAPGHPENGYCRSDHFHYARWGIPVVFFTTGLHGDYHQVTDEPQYVSYVKLARVGRLVHDVALRIANADRRPVVDGKRLDAAGRCQQ